MLRAPGIAALTVLAWAACVIASDGVLSLLLDLDVVPERGAGSLVGPAMIAAAVLALLVRLLLGTARGRCSLLPVETLFGTYLVLLVVGSVAYAIVRGEAATALLFAAGSALSVFVLLPAVLAGVAGVVFVAMLRAQDLGAGPPKWPWERDDR